MARRRHCRCVWFDESPSRAIPFRSVCGSRGAHCRLYVPLSTRTVSFLPPRSGRVNLIQGALCPTLSATTSKLLARRYVHSFRRLYDQMPAAVDKPYPALDSVGFEEVEGQMEHVGIYTTDVNEVARRYRDQRNRWLSLVETGRRSRADEAFVAAGRVLIALALALRVNKVTRESGVIDMETGKAMAHEVEFDAAIRTYYEERDEENRLTRGASQLEAERTRQLVGRHLMSPPATVLDVGGAGGAYSLWLAGEGYDVHLIDPVDRLVDEARRRSSGVQRGLASCRVGDARELPFANESADAILLLGPLYHLTSKEDRLRALTEGRRVLRPDGVLIAAAITRWASALDALARDYFAIPGRAAVVERALKDGQHRNLGGAGGFTTAFFHRPDELEDEVRESGLSPRVLYAVEGPAGYFPDFDERWADERQRGDMLRIAEALETEAYLLGASPHLLIVAGK